MIIIQNSHQATLQGKTVVTFGTLRDTHPVSDFVTVEQGVEEYAITDSKKLLRVIGGDAIIFAYATNSEPGYNKIVSDRISSNTTLDASLICSLDPTTGQAEIASEFILVPVSENIKIEFDPEYVVVDFTAVGSITELTEQSLNSESEE